MALETSLWLTPDFVEKMLRKSEKTDSIQIIDIFCKLATSKGDNYTSDIYRVTVEFSRHQGDRETTEKRSIIIKVEPTGNSLQMDMLTKGKFFDTEISMFTDALVKMNEILGPSGRLSPRVLYVQQTPFILAMEDLAACGFRMGDRIVGLDLDHCILVVKAIAKFHASSVALCEKEPKYKKMYTRGIFNKNNPEEVTDMCIRSFKSLAKEVETWPELGPRYAEKIRNFANKSYQKCCKIAECREEEFNVINHGDCWSNNVMFKYNDEGKVIEQIFVDFQMCVYTSPAIDLHYFLSTSRSDEALDQTDLLLEEYQRTLSSTMARLKCKTAPPSLESLKKILNDKVMYEMGSATMVLPFLTIDKDDAKGLNEILSDPDAFTPAKNNPRFRKIMFRLLPKYEKMGLLD